jgi:methylated-DNA-[protein]-cysteine S-methyltransferase
MVLEEGSVVRARRANLRDYVDAIKALTMLIPPGCVTTYSVLARLLAIHPRLVGRALALNEDPIIVPCHRVVGSHEDLRGYTPLGPRFKERLLKMEGVKVVDGRVKGCVITDPESLLAGSMAPPGSS